MAVAQALALFLASSLLLAAPASALTYFEGHLNNGNFEEMPKPTDLNKTVLIGKHSLPTWEINGFIEYISGRHQPGGMFYQVAHGVHAVKLGNEASISQTMKVKSGSPNAVTFGDVRLRV